MTRFLPRQYLQGRLASVSAPSHPYPATSWEVCEKGLEEDSFTQTYLGCSLTIYYSYLLYLFLSTVGKQFQVCAVPWGIYR